MVHVILQTWTMTYRCTASNPSSLGNNLDEVHEILLSRMKLNAKFIEIAKGMIQGSKKSCSMLTVLSSSRAF